MTNILSKSGGRSCSSKYPYGTHQYNILLIIVGTSNSRWETTLRQTRHQKKSHDNGSERRIQGNCEVRDANKSRGEESGYKMKVEVLISCKQCWPETITTTSKN